MINRNILHSQNILQQGRLCVCFCRTQTNWLQAHCALSHCMFSTQILIERDVIKTQIRSEFAFISCRYLKNAALRYDSKCIEQVQQIVSECINCLSVHVNEQKHNTSNSVPPLRSEKQWERQKHFSPLHPLPFFPLILSSRLGLKLKNEQDRINDGLGKECAENFSCQHTCGVLNVSLINEWIRCLRYIKGETQQVEKLISLNLLKQQDTKYDRRQSIKMCRDSEYLQKHSSRAFARDAVSLQDLFLILDTVPTKSRYTAARLKIAFILLYFTGLRVSRLLDLNCQHYDELKNKGELYLRVHSTKNDYTNATNTMFDRRESIGVKMENKNPFQIHLKIEENLKEMLSKYQDEGTIITSFKSLNEPLFTSAKSPGRRISREFFDYQLNKVCARVSEQVNKHIRTHSFRIQFIEKHLRDKSIEHVQKLVAHNDIKATALYKRSFSR